MRFYATGTDGDALSCGRKLLQVGGRTKPHDLFVGLVTYNLLGHTIGLSR
jgi:hypothetical protein